MMKTPTWKFVALLILLLILSLGLNYRCYTSKKQYKATIGQLQLQLSDTQQSVALWQDKEGKSRAEIEKLNLTLNEVKGKYELAIKKASRETSIPKRRIKSITNVALTTRDSSHLEQGITQKKSQQPVIVQVRQEIPPGEIFSIKSHWADITATMGNDSRIGLVYEVRDSVSFVSYEKGGMLSKKRIFLQGVSHNPNTRITGIDHLEIVPKDRRMGFGIGAGIGLTADGITPYVGLVVSYNIFRW